jgi:3'(2'), 5'-bisphosphate nucleotidase
VTDSPKVRVDRALLDVLSGIAGDAGRAIMEVYAGDFAAWEKSDASPLTHADLQADAVIRRGLEAAFPGVFILSEESSSSGVASAQTFFLVDPLDGTREFVKRNGEFTVNIALVDSGSPVAGVVAAPALGELFFGARGVGCWMRGTGGDVPLTTAKQGEGGPLRVIGSRSHAGDSLAAWLGRLGCAHEFVAAGSSLKFCRLAQGQADVYPRLGPTSQWDTGAGQAVLEAAGGAVLDPQGRPLRYGLQRPILNPDFIALADPGFRYPELT